MLGGTDAQTIFGAACGSGLVISLLSLIFVSFPSFPSSNGPDNQIVNRTLKSDRAIAPILGKGMRSQPSLSRAYKKVRWVRSGFWLGFFARIIECLWPLPRVNGLAAGQKTLPDEVRQNTDKRRWKRRGRPSGSFAAQPAAGRFLSHDETQNSDDNNTAQSTRGTRSRASKPISGLSNNESTKARTGGQTRVISRRAPFHFVGHLSPVAANRQS